MTDSKLGKHVAQNELVVPTTVVPGWTWFVLFATAPIEASPRNAAGFAAQSAALSSTVLRI